MATSGDSGAGSSSADAAADCTCGSNNCAECCGRRSLSSYSYPVQDYDKLWRVCTASIKGFAVGAGLKGGLSILALITRLRRRQLLRSSRKVEMSSGSADLIMALKETLRYGLFLGTFAGTFVSVDEIIAALGGHRRTAKWRALLAGAIAGPSILLTGLNTQHTSLAIYVLIFAMVLASRCGIKSKRFGRLCKPLTWEHGDIFLMCLASSKIMLAYILKIDSLPQSFKLLLKKHGVKDHTILNGFREIACGLPLTNLEAIQKVYKSNGVDIKLDPQMKIPCSIIHGTQACGPHFFSILLQAQKVFVPIYLPVNLIRALIVQRRDLLKRPHTILWKSLLSTARSSLSISACFSSGWLWTCILFRIFKRCNIPLLAIATFLSGVALAIEKKSRRIEISLFFLARAMEICVAEAGNLPRVFKRADALVFSISTAIIMHCFAMERDIFRSKYLLVLDWVFGVPLPLYETTSRKRR